MNPVTEGNFDTTSTDQLVALREQRALLGDLRDDVHEAWLQLGMSDLDASWRSSSQRAYADRLEYLRRELQGVMRELNDAEAAVNGCIDRVTAGA